MKNKFLICCLMIVMGIALIAMAGGCKNKDCHKDGTCKPEYYRFGLREAKPYLWANVGSWWIYKNTKTGDLDTEVVTYFYYDSAKIKGTEDYSQHITIEYDILKRTISSTFNQWEYRETTFKPDPNGAHGTNYLMRYDRTVSGEGTIYPFFYEFNTSYGIGNGSTTSFYRGMDSTLNIQGKTYKEVVRFEINMDDIWYPEGSVPIQLQYPNAFYYWAKDVGLIKRFNKNENYSWELIDYNIIK